MQSERAVLLDNPEDVTTYSWRRMVPTLAQLLESRPEELAALGDWQNKGGQPDVGHSITKLLFSEVRSLHQD
jgi:hypothetical protein